MLVSHRSDKRFGYQPRADRIIVDDQYDAMGNLSCFGAGENFGDMRSDVEFFGELVAEAALAIHFEKPEGAQTDEVPLGPPRASAAEFAATDFQAQFDNGKEVGIRFQKFHNPVFIRTHSAQ